MHTVLFKVTLVVRTFHKNRSSEVSSYSVYENAFMHRVSFMINKSSNAMRNPFNGINLSFIIKILLLNGLDTFTWKVFTLWQLCLLNYQMINKVRIIFISLEPSFVNRWVWLKYIIVSPVKKRILLQQFFDFGFFFQWIRNISIGVPKTMVRHRIIIWIFLRNFTFQKVIDAFYLLCDYILSQ